MTSKGKILVTGGTGYIGSHMVAELHAQGYQTIIVDNLSRSVPEVIDWLTEVMGTKPVFYKVDCTDYEAMKKVVSEHPDILGVMHFAAFKAVGESVDFPYMYYDNNLNSLLSVLKVMREFHIENLIFSSSCTVYGVPEDGFVVNEDTPLSKASSPYGETKLICEKILEARVENTPLKVVSLRYFNPVGAHESSLIGELPVGKPSNLIPFVTQTAIGIRDQLTIFGNDYDTPDGTNIRDYIHVTDVARSHIKAMEFLFNKEIQDSKGFVEVFNIGTGKGHSVLEVVTKFQEVNGVTLNYKIGNRRQGDVPAIFATNKRAMEVLGWKPEYSLEDSLKSAWKWQLKLKERHFNE